MPAGAQRPGGHGQPCRWAAEERATRCCCPTTPTARTRRWRGRTGRLGHHPPPLRPDEPAGPGRQDQRPDPIGLAGGAGSVTLEFPDLMRAGAPVPGARRHHARWTTPGAPAWPSTRSTWTPVWAVAVDLSAHALTKYPSGGGDVLMGSVTTRDEALHLKLKLSHMRLGTGVGANDAEAVLRALPSIGPALPRAGSGSAGAGTWCESQPQFVQVLHPALPRSPGHAHWRAPVRRPSLRPCTGWLLAVQRRSWIPRTRQRRWMPSATRWNCSSWATAGAGRSAWWFPMRWPACAPTGRRTWRAARWCGSRSDWRRGRSAPGP
jgi:hypothetical protein